MSHCGGCPLGYQALCKLQIGAAAEWYRQDSAQGLGVLWLQLAALVKERDFAVASKHAAAEAMILALIGSTYPSDCAQ